MPGNPREMITMAERRFPVRVRLAVPPGGRKEILRGKSRDHDTGETYYRHWLAAIERVVVEKGVTEPAAPARYRDAWDRAAKRTPHGAPIVLQPKDFVP
jgi:hypothetical protein